MDNNQEPKLKRSKPDSSNSNGNAETDNAWCLALSILDKGVRARSRLIALLYEAKTKNPLTFGVQCNLDMSHLFNSPPEPICKYKAREYLSSITAALKTTLRFQHVEQFVVYFSLWSFYKEYFGNSLDILHCKFPEANNSKGIYSVSDAEYLQGMKLLERTQ